MELEDSSFSYPTYRANYYTNGEPSYKDVSNGTTSKKYDPDDDNYKEDDYDEYQELLDEVDQWRNLSDRAQDVAEDAVAEAKKLQQQLVDVRAALEVAQNQLEFADTLARACKEPVVFVEAEFFGDTLDVSDDLVRARDNYVEVRGMKP